MKEETWVPSGFKKAKAGRSRPAEPPPLRPEPRAWGLVSVDLSQPRAEVDLLFGDGDYKPLVRQAIGVLEAVLAGRLRARAQA